MPERIALLFAVGLALIAVFPIVLAIAAPPSGSGAANPLSVTSFEMEGLQSPAGPTVTLVVENVGSIPIAVLSATLELQSEYTISFPNVTAAAPLDIEGTASVTTTLVGGGFSCGVSYPLQFVGWYSTGIAFGFTVEQPIACPG